MAEINPIELLKFGNDPSLTQRTVNSSSAVEKLMADQVLGRQDNAAKALRQQGINLTSRQNNMTNNDLPINLSTLGLNTELQNRSDLRQDTALAQLMNYWAAQGMGTELRPGDTTRSYGRSAPYRPLGNITSPAARAAAVRNVEKTTIADKTQRAATLGEDTVGKTVPRTITREVTVKGGTDPGRNFTLPGSKPRKMVPPKAAAQPQKDDDKDHPILIDYRSKDGRVGNWKWDSKTEKYYRMEDSNAR